MEIDTQVDNSPAFGDFSVDAKFFLEHNRRFWHDW
jgi:hypothetical protein